MQLPKPGRLPGFFFCMSCQCNERRNAIVQDVRNAVRGEVKDAAVQARFVVASTVEDASAFVSGQGCSCGIKTGEALMLSINYDLSSLKNISNALHAAGEKMPLVLNRAINHTGDKALTQMRNVLVGQTG